MPVLKRNDAWHSRLVSDSSTSGSLQDAGQIVDAGQAHATLSDGRDFQPALSQSSFLHRFLFQDPFSYKITGKCSLGDILLLRKYCLFLWFIKKACSPTRSGVYCSDEQMRGEDMKKHLAKAFPRPVYRASELSSDLARKIASLIGSAEKRITEIPGLSLHRRSAPTGLCPATYEPSNPGRQLRFQFMRSIRREDRFVTSICHNVSILHPSG